MDVKISAEEIIARKDKWQPPKAKKTAGYLARYTAMVTSGARGQLKVLE